MANQSASISSYFDTLQGCVQEFLKGSTASPLYTIWAANSSHAQGPLILTYNVHAGCTHTLLVLQKVTCLLTCTTSETRNKHSPDSWAWFFLGGGFAPLNYGSNVSSGFT